MSVIMTPDYACRLGETGSQVKTLYGNRKTNRNIPSFGYTTHECDIIAARDLRMHTRESHGDVAICQVALPVLSQGGIVWAEFVLVSTRKVPPSFACQPVREAAARV